MGAFNAYFYKFNKRINSTDVPTAEDVVHTLSVTLKAGSSIISPVLEIANGATFSEAIGINYCAIPMLKRYYYVTDTTYERGVWYLSLKVDVLATYRVAIGADTRYILRASAESDGALTDMMYPTKCATSYQKATKSFWADRLENGCYVVTTLSTRGEGIGPAKIWAFTPAQFKTFVDTLFGEEKLEVGELVVNSALVNALINTEQYITKCVWYPFPVSQLTGTTLQEALFVGSKGLPIPCYSVSDSVWECLFTLSLEDKKHPQIDRGVYMARNPFSKYQLFIPPFGVVPFDVVGAGFAFAMVTISVDLLTGAGKLVVVTGDGEQHTATANVGIDVPLAQLEPEYVSKIGSLVTQTGGIMSAAVSGNVAGVVAGGFGAIGSAWDSWESLAVLGSLGGNLNAYRTDAFLFALYIHAAEDAPESYGRPLCATRKISTIPGFIQCGDGYTKTGGTIEENNEVNKFMKEGFYFV